MMPSPIVGGWQLQGGFPPSSPSLLQDEVEFGYVQAPHKTFPVVFDSPRDRGLKDFPVKSILVSDPVLPSPAGRKAFQTHKKNRINLFFSCIFGKGRASKAGGLGALHFGHLRLFFNHYCLFFPPFRAPILATWPGKRQRVLPASIPSVIWR